MQAPCKNCKDRVVGCHSNCEKYIAYVKVRDKIRAKNAEDKLVTGYFVDVTKRRSRGGFR